MEGTDKIAEKAPLQPCGLSKLTLPVRKILRRNLMQPAEDQGIALSVGVAVDQFPRSLEMPTPLRMAPARDMVTPGYSSMLSMRACLSSG